jgi:HEAT repeat protein
MLRYVVLAALGVAAAALLALRARWSAPLARRLRWSAEDEERNSRVLLMGLLVTVAGAAIWIALMPFSLDKEIADLAQALSGAEVTNLDDVPAGSIAAKRLEAMQSAADADEVFAAADRFRDRLEAKEASARTEASYRLWICAWLLRRMGDARGDDLALDLWHRGDFIKPAIKDRLRTPEQLAAALDDKDPIERGQAARILGEVADRKAGPALVVALGDSDATVREYAALALARCGDPRDAPAVARLLADPERDVRLAAAEALGRIGTPSVIEALKALYLREDDWQVRAEVVRTLGKIGDASGGSLLVTALADRHDKVREAALTALKRIGPALAPLLDETIATTANPWVRDAAREARAAVGSLPSKP